MSSERINAFYLLLLVY